MERNIKLNNDVLMPRLGFGVYKIDSDQMLSVFNTAIASGYRAFDTAYFYFNEKALGEAIKASSVPREELFITTKLWNDHQGYDSTIETFNASLERLGLDYLDLYLIHWPCPKDDLFIETYRAMEDLYKAGKIKAIGVCNFKQEHLEKLLSETEIVPVVNQIEYHPYFNQSELQSYCESKGIQVTAWSPLMRGGELMTHEKLVAIGNKHQKTPAQVIIRWHLQSNRLVIPKSVTPSRIEENIDVFDFELSEDEMQQINDLNQNQRQFRDPSEVKIGDMK